MAYLIIVSKIGNNFKMKSGKSSRFKLVKVDIRDYKRLKRFEWEQNPKSDSINILSKNHQTMGDNQYYPKFGRSLIANIFRIDEITAHSKIRYINNNYDDLTRENLIWEY